VASRDECALERLLIRAEFETWARKKRKKPVEKKV